MSAAPLTVAAPGCAQMLLSAFGVQQDSIEALLADVREQAQGALDEYGLVLHPALLAQLRPLADQMQTLLVHVYGVLELVRRSPALPC